MIEAEIAGISCRALLESVPDAVVVVDGEGRVLYANGRAAALFGYTTEELRRMTVDALLPDRLRARHAEHRARYARRPHARGMGALQDLFARHRDGTELPVEVGLSPLEGSEGQRVVASIRDARERRELERRTEVTEHLATLGTLTTGIAHEVTSPLTYVLGNLELGARLLERVLTTALADPSAARASELEQHADHLRRCLAEATEGAERMRLIVGDLRTLGRVESPSRTLCDVREVVDAALRITMGDLLRRAEVVRELDGSPPVRGSATRLGQVVINLLVNAAQALPEPRTPDARIVVRCGLEPTDGAFIEVEDNGVGIPPEHLPHVFDRFFTTKPVGEGTGLGLAICDRIVRDLGGSITLRSQPGRGTVVRVRLPIVHRSSVPPRGHSEPAAGERPRC